LNGFQPLSELASRFGEWRRDRRRVRKKRAKLLTSDVVLISHSKCGRTWLLTMLSRYFHARYGTPADQLIDGDNFHKTDARIPSLFYTSGWGVENFADFEDVLARKRVIFLYRDPRDVVVSWFHHLSSRRKAFGRPSSFQGQRIPEKLTGAVALEPFWLPGVVGYMNKWLRRCRQVAHRHFVSYESMRADPEKALLGLLAFMQVEIDPASVAEAVSFGRFENMSKLEREGFFAGGRLGGGDPVDPNSFKVRRGNVGGYRVHFRDEEIALLDDYVRGHLDPAFGYEGEDRPGGTLRNAELKVAEATRNHAAD
jgi:hypothetical protein